MRRLLCGLLLPALLACGREKGEGATPTNKGAAVEDWSGVENNEDAPVPEEFKPALRLAFQGLNPGEKAIGAVGPFGGKTAEDRYILVAFNAPAGDDRVARFYLLKRGGDNSAPPAYETGIPYGEGRTFMVAVDGIADRDGDGLKDIRYCRFNTVDQPGTAFVVGYRYDAWYRLDLSGTCSRRPGF
jgi:hypothetical protein